MTLPFRKHCEKPKRRKIRKTRIRSNSQKACPFLALLNATIAILVA
jgi:hypothetical protein